jgi:Ser/Thr protein kinase RdoA (MazF antagonist)
VERWAAPGVERLRNGLGGSHRLAWLEEELRTGLVGRQVTMAWIHGDFWGGNVLVSADGAVVLGVVDWDLAERDALASLDVVHLAVMRRALERRRMFGDVACERLEGRAWAPDDRILLAAGGVPLGDDEFERAVLLLAWLRHVAANLAQRDDYARRPIWVRRNVVEVLRSLASDDAASGSRRSQRFVA